jgi:DNA-binding NtrC family response regulator
MGAKKAERARPRLIASTECDLGELVREGRFSAELYAKLVACVIEVPPVREIHADLPLLVEHFLLRYGAPRGVRAVDGSVLTLAQQYEWPGNLAELEDAMEDACRKAGDATSIAIEHLPRALRDLDAGLDSMELVPQAPPHRSGITGPGAGIPISEGGLRRIRPWDITDEDPISLDLYEKKALLRALENCGGDKLAAARLLKVGKSTLYRTLKRLGIS